MTIIVIFIANYITLWVIFDLSFDFLASFSLLQFCYNNITILTITIIVISINVILSTLNFVFIIIITNNNFFFIWPTCIRSTGQVGGLLSRASLFRRNVTSKPKPLGSPGEAALRMSWIRSLNSPPQTSLRVRADCWLLVDSAVAMEVGQAAGDVMPMSRGLRSAISAVGVNADIVQRVRSTEPVPVRADSEL